MNVLIFLIILGILGTIAIVPVKSKSNQLERADLKKETENIKTTSSDSILLSDQILQNKVTPTFVTEHIDYLIDNARQSSKTLEIAKPIKQIKVSYEETKKLSDNLQQNLEKIASNPTNKLEILNARQHLYEINHLSQLLDKNL